MKLPPNVSALVGEIDSIEGDPMRVIFESDLEREWPSVDCGRAALIRVVRRVAEHYAFTDHPLGKVARKALKEAKA